MKILIIDNSIALTGALKCALNEAEILSDRHSFCFLLPTGSAGVERVQTTGFQCYQLPMKEVRKSAVALLKYPFYLAKNLIAVRSIINRNGIDVVQINDYYNMLGACLRITGFRGKLITYVRFLPSSMPKALSNFWIRIARKYSDHVIAVSNAVLNHLPSVPQAIRIYDPVYLREDHLAGQKKNADKTYFLYLANFTRGKGQEHAIQAFRDLYKTNQNVHLTFVGGDMGLKKNREFREELVRLAKDLGLAGSIQFSPFSPDIEREIKRSDVLLNFSESESFSLTCLEASYYGIPVIATRCGGPEEIIADGRTGILVAPGNIGAMTTAMRVLTENRHLRNEYGDAAREYVREKFAVSRFREQFSKLLTHD